MLSTKNYRKNAVFDTLFAPKSLIIQHFLCRSLIFGNILTHGDDLGRIVIPKEIRRTMRIREGDPSLMTLTPWQAFCFAMLNLSRNFVEKPERSQQSCRQTK